ncbi:hypothetical protein [Marasmitruncus massiliensis]|nr:hypothetical protein [Marasmitruncus massiliensis]
MASLKIEEIIDSLSFEMKKALKESVEKYCPVLVLIHQHYLENSNGP